MIDRIEDFSVRSDEHGEEGESHLKRSSGVQAILIVLDTKIILTCQIVF